MNHRWFALRHYSRKDLLDSKDKSKLSTTITDIIDNARAGGLNGMVLNMGLHNLDAWSSDELKGLVKLQGYCSPDIELIPSMFGVGGGGGCLTKYRSLLAARPTTLYLKAYDLPNGPTLLASVPGPNGEGDVEFIGPNTDGMYKAKLAHPEKFNRVKNGHMGWSCPIPHQSPCPVALVLDDFDTLPEKRPPTRAMDFEMAADGSVVVNYSTRFTFSSPAKKEHYVSQKVSVLEDRYYRLTFKLRIEGLDPVTGLFARVVAPSRTENAKRVVVRPCREIEGLEKKTAADGWLEVTLDYHNDHETEVEIHIGTDKADTGSFCINDIQFYEYADLSDIARSDGTPLALMYQKSPTGPWECLAEGFPKKQPPVPYSVNCPQSDSNPDFPFIQCLSPKTTPKPKTNGLPQYLVVPAGRIKDKTVTGPFKLSCYKISVWRSDTPTKLQERRSTCLTNDFLYGKGGHFQQRLADLKGEGGIDFEGIDFQRVFVPLDEIRNGGGCLSSDGMVMSEILAAFITELQQRCAELGVSLVTFGDMLDPKMNARDEYFNTVYMDRSTTPITSAPGSFVNVAKNGSLLIDYPRHRMLTVVTWNSDHKEASVEFFSDPKKGFGGVFGSAYFANRKSDLDNAVAWLNALLKCGGTGIIYDTYTEDYNKLQKFGELLKEGGE